MKNITTRIGHSLVFFILTWLCGCTIIPGAHISSGFLGESRSNSNNIDIIPISSQLIVELNSNQLLPDNTPAIDLQKKYDNYSYKVGIGDVLNITVWDHPELTIPAGQFRSAGETGNVVHPDGTIFYPYVGKVDVIGKPVTEIRSLITENLGRFIEAPQIDVSVAAFRSQRVFVSGAVVQPSTVPITNVPLTLLDALNACGGMSPDADWRSVVITRDTPQGTVKEVVDIYALYQQGDMSQNRLLGGNDVIHVPRNDGLKVFVMGDVVKASTQRMDRSGLTLAEALNNSGGIDESSANASGIFVLRASPEQDKVVDVFQLDASMGSMLILSTQFQLQPMDIVYVTSAPLARWNKIIQQLLPSFTSFYQLERAAAE
ncbi:MAG: hypothetical protein CBC07_002935 [Cellvibrionales bacterium TMED47]|nr:hypothetical protein [Porticoccaceae bacterium]RPG83748.1 MAG: hypothetical protein CBC07_002935 [Cellvibrionales bacterium TMED47]